MSMYQCYECDSIFYEPKIYTEYMGEYWGASAYETTTGCPYCHGGFGEVKECDVCGELVFADRVYKGACFECAEQETAI